MDGDVLTEVPQNLQMLVRLVVRGFYMVEDVLIVDMLVRNLCMSEEDLCELLKFDRKMLRQRINTLKTDKLLQARMKLVTLEDGKTQREQYYFINYKSFVNVVKYKLDHIRKKLEMEERVQTSRASFKCEHCRRTYTDLETDQLLDPQTGELLCVICRCEVQEDMSGMPRHDTRILLSRFNDQMEPLFALLKEVENIKLSAEFSEPRPQDFSDIKRGGQGRTDKRGNGNGVDHGKWSQKNSKNQGFQVDSSIDVSINNENGSEENVVGKEKPIWLSEATSFITTNITSNDPAKNETKKTTASFSSTSKGPSIASLTSSSDDVLSLLQQHERKSKKDKASESDSEDSDDDVVQEVYQKKPPPAALLPRAPLLGGPSGGGGPIEEITISDDDEYGDAEGEPFVIVGGDKLPLSDVDNDVIARMTQEEKNAYINTYQEYYGAMDD